MSPIPTHPLILTLTLDAPTHKFLTSLRTKYFPSNRNHLSAHLTLFHAIPGSKLPILENQIHKFMARPGFDVYVGRPKRMGNRGVMVGLRSEKPGHAIEGIHRSILSELKKDHHQPETVSAGGHDQSGGGTRDVPGAHQQIKHSQDNHHHHPEHTQPGGKGEEGLTNQDLMKLVHPHITIMNKAENPEDIEVCLEEVEALFGRMESGERKGRAVGFELWEYMGGPWKPFKQYLFKGEEQDSS